MLVLTALLAHRSLAMDEYGIINTRSLVMDTVVIRTGKVGHVVARRQIEKIGQMCEMAFLDQPWTESYWDSEKDADAHLTFAGGRYWVCASGFSTGKEVKCPYQVGDLLWVRETWAHSPTFCENAPNCGLPSHIYYREIEETNSTFDSVKHWHWRPSIFMPRWASRINLKVRSVRLEWLQDISEQDAQAEGVSPMRTPVISVPTGQFTGEHYRPAFAMAWNDINAKRGYPWKSNPQVWRVEFAPIEKAY